MHDVPPPPPRPLPLTEENTPPATPASYRVPPGARYLPTAFVHSGRQEDWVPKRGSYHPTAATSARGSYGQTIRRAPPEAADGRKTSRGGEVQARNARSRTGWIVSRTTSKRSEPRTALRWTTGLHSELTEPYGPLQQRWAMGRLGTRECCRERKHSCPPGTRKRRTPADDVRPNEPFVILSLPHICRYA